MQFGELHPVLNLPESESSFKIPLSFASSRGMRAALRDCHGGTGHLWQSHTWKRSPVLKGFFCLEEPSVCVNRLWKRCKKMLPGGQVKASSQRPPMLTYSVFVKYGKYQFVVT